MSLRLKTSLIFLSILAGLLLVWGIVQAAQPVQAAQALSTPTRLPDQFAGEAPDISFIDSPTATCELARAKSGVCYITWSYLYASADPNYMITMTVEIDGKARARYNGFFQTSMYVPPEMLVFRVACGAPGSGGSPNLGMNHSYILRARDSAGLSAANYGSVSCPADVPHTIYLPLLRK